MITSREQPKHSVAVFAGGCFWCTEAIFRMLKGVISVVPGYCGGDKKDATYDKVSAGQSGHAEAVKIEYDSQVISYQSLLTVFFATHDPTTLNRQGADIGTQYRSAIFYENDNDKNEALSFIDNINNSHMKGKKIVTEVVPLETFYEAENYHRDYYERNKSAPYCELVINPKLEKVQKDFANLLK
jgi:peptide-methionine (S)-S-oxide reductase